MERVLESSGNSTPSLVQNLDDTTTGRDADEEVENGVQHPMSSTAVQEVSPRTELQFPRGPSVMTPSPIGSSESEPDSEDEKAQAKPAKKVKMTSTDDLDTASEKSKTDTAVPVEGNSNSRSPNDKRSAPDDRKPSGSGVLTKKLKVNFQYHDEADILGSQQIEGALSTPQTFQLIPLSQMEGPYPGVIKSLRLQNFMCHADFTHNFHTNLNFITGQNGSGKSALLSGILIALGGRAAATSRTTTLKTLIQKGKNSCHVSVTLLNRNGLGRFGEEITIERWHHQSGNGGYRINSTGGANAFDWRPLKKTELDDILLSFNIQIDNPMAILNQEVARNFLRSTDPKVKYRLFYDGTLLKPMEKEIEEAQVRLQETDALLTQHRAGLHTMRKDIEQLKKKCDKISELELLKNELTKLNHEYLWSLVIQQENVVSEANLQTRRAKKELEFINTTLEKAENAYENLNEQSVIEEFARLREKVSDKKHELDETRTEINEVKRNIIQLQAKLKTAIGTVASKQAMIDRVTLQIAQLTAQQQARFEEEANLEIEQGLRLEEQKKQLELVASSIKFDADNFQMAAGLEQEKIQKLDSEKRNLQSEIESRNKLIKSLSINANKYAAFGPKMNTLMSKIQASQHQFNKPPRGPLGSTFRVKDPKYAATIEKILSRDLSSFVVDNMSDFGLLTEMIDSTYNERLGAKPNITMMEFSPELYDISRNMPSHPGAYTIFELLEVENNDHIVLNALIDTSQIERILIFETNAEAADILKRQSTVPKSLKMAFTLEWFKFSPALRYSAKVMTVMDRAKILKSGKGQENEVAALKEEIKALELKLKNLETQREKLEAKEKSMRQAYTEKMNELSATRRHLNQVVNEKKKLANLKAQRAKACDLTSYQEELDELKEDIESQLSVRDSVTKELEPLNSKLTILDNKRMQIQGDYEKFSSDMSAFEAKRDEFKTKKIEAENLIKRLKAEMLKLHSKLASLETAESKCINEEAAKEKELQEKMNNAMAVCLERIDTVRTPDNLQRENENMQIRIEETEAQLGDVDELQCKLYNKKQKYKKHYREYQSVRRLYSITLEVSNSQKRNFEIMKFHMGRTLQLFYLAMVKQRGYEGRLIVDTSTEELYYFVCPDGASNLKTLKAMDAQEESKIQPLGGDVIAEQARKNKELRNALMEYSLGLSGGERSFATICFVMALWQVMECPFYVLDEFDVFMDELNRKTCQIALIAHAKKFKKYQFTFFTPLDLSETPKPEEACVLKLCPPLRDAEPAESSNSEDGSGLQTGVAESSDSPGSSGPQHCAT